MQVTRNGLQELVEKKLGEKVPFTKLQPVFYPGKRLRADANMEITDKKFKQGVQQLAKDLGLDDPYPRTRKGAGKSEAADPPPSTSTSLERVQRSRRFRQVDRVSDVPRKADYNTLEKLQKELERYWEHEEANNPFRPKPTRRGSVWVYDDPMISGGEIEISAAEQQAYLKDPELSYIDRSDQWIRSLVRLLGSLSIVAHKCPVCELRLKTLLKTKVHKLLDKEYRLPRSPQPPGVKKSVPVIKFKKGHEDCRMMHPDYVEVLTALSEEIKKLKEMPKGPKRKRKTLELKAEFKARAKTVIRDTAQKLQDKHPEQKVDMDELRLHAVAIVALIEEDLSDG